MKYPMIQQALKFFIFLLLFFQMGFVSAQGGVYVDDQGVMRWESSKEEIKGFGVNYTTPFAHAYRSAIKLGINPLEAIDQDVYHFARLGFDLYRVHVWDTEISDTLGNLIFNEHLNAFDYLLKKLSERNINYVITPIAYWGNGWPEPDELTPGFAAKYGKDACLTNPDAIKAQENYLYQFLNHVNPYTGIAYKDDPRLIAVEVSNEPHHREAPEKVTDFVRLMVNSIRKTGYKKPIFYNISHSVHLVNDYFKGGIQGGTFQWYPTGLGYQRELSGNILPNADNYLIPFDKDIKKYKGAKLVYEFDAADVGRSYIYPAMARSFREAGIQIATHFAYDPMFLAYANTEYNTHYMNLAYAPQKALSLMISSEVFHQIPMYKDYGAYPDNTTFDGFTVNYEQDLALLNIDNKFYYTNNNTATPVNESALEHIAGYGNSALITYEGTGAYFLDKLENGVWRLEVMPDAQIVSNPYGRNSLQKEVAVIQWNQRSMKINLKDIGNNFNIIPLNKDNHYKTEVNDGNFMITPGVYLLTKSGINSNWDAQSTFGNIKLYEFHAPENSVRKTYVVHEKVETAIAGEPLTINAQIVSPEPIVQAQVSVAGGFRGRAIDMQWKHGFTYEAIIPGEQINPGVLSYYIIVKSKDKTITFPAEKEGLPSQWDFYNRETYNVNIRSKEQPVYLFHAQEDRNYLSATRWLNNSRLIPLDALNESEFQVNVEELFRVDPENLNAPAIYDYTIKNYLNKKIGNYKKQLINKTKLILKARSLNEKPVLLQIALITKDGAAYGKTIEIGAEMQEYEILLKDLQKVNTVTMPRPYPTFLPYYFVNNNNNKDIDLQEIEGLQFSIGPGISQQKRSEKHGVSLVSLMLK
ncbi:MAG: hypothetical protein IPJ74_04205 [Saprospiraceae bacterium]|nr:hypothetical protein [Saprospiraceae bacterium]